MGVADLGLKNVSGTLRPYSYGTSSVEGAANISRAVSIYLEGDGPDLFGLQLNAVATGVTVGTDTSAEFWAQDTAAYSPSQHRLTFVDDLWNFSGVNAPIPGSTIYAHAVGGSFAGSTYYYDVGPSVTITYPFQVNFTLNATTVAGRPAVTFGYTVSNRTLDLSAVYDTVVFNASPAVMPFAAPVFSVNGSSYNPAGLLDDFEFVLVGDAAGDTTSFFNASAHLRLDFYNSTAAAYQAVPAAFNAGADTGETSDGVSVTFSTPGVANVATGPSFLGGLWGVSTNSGGRTFSDKQTPANAFLFVSPGSTFNASAAQWVPAFPLPSATPPGFVLPNGGPYTFEWLLSGWQELNLTVAAATNSSTALVETLSRNATSGVYTPLFALGNGGLGAISQSGNGTPSNPFVLKDRPGGPIDPVFGQLNDFGYPVFPGILLINTSKWVDVSPATFSITYPSWDASILEAWNLPGSNDLSLNFWGVTNLTVGGGSPVTGWFPAMASLLFDASLLFWNSTGNLVAGATFEDQGVSLALYGGTGDTIWGNTFLASSVPSLGPNATLDATNETGVVVAASGDLIYNNYFEVPLPALTPTNDPASCLFICAPADYTDLWNTTHESATDVRTVLGTNLTGSILHTSFQGGNFWSNYGSSEDPYGVLPYTDGGAIANGGDAWPLLPFSLFNITFTVAGLPSGASWGVDFGGLIVRSTGTVIAVSDPNGSYAVTYLAPAGFAPPRPGNVTVQGASLALPAPFSALAVVEFVESGLVANWNWNVSVVAANGSGPNATASSTTSDANVSLPNGSFDFSISSRGYNATPQSGSFTVPTTRTITTVFSLVPLAEFVAVNITPGTSWYITVTQGGHSLSVGTGAVTLNLTQFDLAPGAYSWAANATGWTATNGTGTGTTAKLLVQYVYFYAIPGTLNGTVNVHGAAVAVDGQPVVVTNGGFSRHLAPGAHTVVAVAAGYYTYIATVVIYPRQVANVTIEMEAEPPSSTNSFEGISYLGWGLIAGLAAGLAVLSAILLRGRRGPRAPSPLTPAPASATPQPPSAKPAAAWEEAPEAGAAAKPGGVPWDEGEGSATGPPASGPSKSR
jgi:thermopsin